MWIADVDPVQTLFGLRDASSARVGRQAGAGRLIAASSAAPAAVGRVLAGNDLRHVNRRRSPKTASKYKRSARGQRAVRLARWRWLAPRSGPVQVVAVRLPRALAERTAARAATL
jgi:hypothetical protein